MRSEQSDEQSAEQLQEVKHPEARITHRGICASPDTIFGSHSRELSGIRLSSERCFRLRHHKHALHPLVAVQPFATLLVSAA